MSYQSRDAISDMPGFAISHGVLLAGPDGSQMNRGALDLVDG
jgi:hypothetical protein